MTFQNIYNNLYNFFVQGAATPTPSNPFGRVEGYGPVSSFNNPGAGISSLISAGVTIFLSVGGIAALFFLLWGAVDFITSSGEQEKIDKARMKMTYAAVGLILMILALTIFGVVAGDILGIVTRDAAGNWVFDVPRVGACIPQGGVCEINAGQPCCDGICTPGGAGVDPTCQ